jgi:hypothetical protein
MPHSLTHTLSLSLPLPTNIQGAWCWFLELVQTVSFSIPSIAVLLGHRGVVGGGTCLVMKVQVCTLAHPWLGSDTSHYCVHITSNPIL